MEYYEIVILILAFITETSKDNFELPMYYFILFFFYKKIVFAS